MPNYIRTQSPWLAAADAMQGMVNPLTQMYTQLPQVRAQMQQHADQMGIQQGRLNLEQQEMGMKAPVYNAQASNYQAGAGLDRQKTTNLAQLLQFAMQGAQADTNPLTQNMTGAALLDPNAAQQMRNDVTKPMMLNQNETAFTNPQMGEVKPLAQGMMNAPFGNTVLGGTPFGTNQPAVIQQGQFRPPGTMAQNPFLDAFRVAQIAALQQEGSLPEDMNLDPAVLQRVLSGLLQGQTQPGVATSTNRPVIKSIKQIR